MPCHHPHLHLPTPRRPALAQVYAKAGKHSKPPVSLHGQLLWREFYYLVAYATPGFDTMHANPICRQIDWDTNAEHLAVTPRHAKQSACQHT